MPTVPYNPVADVRPSGQGSPYFTDRGATPEAFGAGVGAAKERFGSQLEKAADVLERNVLKSQGLKNEADVNVATTTAIQQSGEETNRFRLLTGSEAQEQLPDHLKKLQTIRETLKGTLTNPEAQSAYDRETMHRFALDTVNSSNYAATQTKQFNKQTNVATQDALEQHMITNWQTPGVIEADVASITALETAHAKTDGVTEGPLLSSRIRSRLTTAVERLAPAIAKSDPDKAQELFNKVKDKIDQARVAGIQNSIDDRGIHYHAVLSGNAITNSVLAPPQATSIGNAIRTQESGNRADIGTSVNGAVGIGQIMPATFKQFALPGESITNPKDNLAVSQRMIDKYTKDYNGDPARVAVAYFSGPGNVAPEGSEKPWKEDRKDGYGKSTSSYVNDIINRLGPTGGQKTALDLNPEGTRAAIEKRVEEESEKLYPAAKDAYLHQQAHDQMLNVAFSKANLAQKEMASKESDLKDWANTLIKQNLPNGRQPINMQELYSLDPNADAKIAELNRLDPNFRDNLDKKFKANASRDIVLPQKQLDDYKSLVKGKSPQDLVKMNPDQDRLDGKIDEKTRTWANDEIAKIRKGQATSTHTDAVMGRNMLTINDMLQKYSPSQRAARKDHFRGALMKELEALPGPPSEADEARIVKNLFAETATGESHWWGTGITAPRYEQVYKKEVQPDWVPKNAEKAPDGNWYVRPGPGQKAILLLPPGEGK